MAKAKQLPSGSWRCMAYLGKDKAGKVIRQSITCATKKEAEDKAKLLEMTAKKSNVLDRDITIGKACDMFIDKKESEVKKGRISPATVKAYRSIRKALVPDIEDIKCIKVTEDTIQNWIDRISEEHSAKTCKNAYSFVRASLTNSRVLPKSTIIDWCIELPYIKSRNVVVPSEADISTLLDYFKKNDKDMYIACLLASFGTLRRSEICAITADDVDRKRNIISVNKAMVRDSIGNYVVKRPKTEGSERDIFMNESIIKLLPTSDGLVNITPDAITHRFLRTVKKLGIHICFHDLRHYSASILHTLGANSQYIMARGGWTVEATLNKHYRGTIDEYTNMYNNLLTQHIENRFHISAS